jgi:hypothetical protein
MAAVRESWLTRIPHNMQAMFFVGTGQSALEKDVVVIPTRDDYESLPRKVQAFYRHCLERYDFDYLFKCDDDTYLVCERLSALIKDGHDFIGSADWWPSHADGGAGYVLSRPATEIVARADCPEFGKEDLWVTGVLRSAGIEFQMSSLLLQNHREFPTPENDIISAHWCSPEIMREIHRGIVAED